MKKTALFVIGGTGYIGGSVLHLIQERKLLNLFDVTVLVRNNEDFSKLKEMGMNPILGTIDNSSLIEVESSKSDIVLSMANCDHQQSVHAMIKGLEKRAQQSAPKPLLIHTSGAGVLSENSNGAGLALENDLDAVIWDDNDLNSFLEIPSYAPHRHVDLEIIDTYAKEIINTSIVVPPTVFGKGLGLFASKRMSIQIPRLVYQSLVNRRVMYVGNGENQWSNVHVADLAELYILMLKSYVESGEIDKIYYPSTEYFIWLDVAKRVAEILSDKKLIVNNEITTGLQNGWFWGSNVRMISSNGNRLGWIPKYGGTREMLADVALDADLMINYISKSR
jgi:nucleoside-diphosphate-sugar epimerase